MKGTVQCSKNLIPQNSLNVDITIISIFADKETEEELD